MDAPIQTGQVITGSLFNEPMRVETIQGSGQDSWTVGLVGLQNERRVAEDRRDCYWLYVVTQCGVEPKLQEPIRDPVRFPGEVSARSDPRPELLT